jgi:hypothetical protein
MFKHDFDTFNQLLSDVGVMYGKQLSTMQVSMYFRALAKYSIEAIQAAIDAHVCNAERGRFMPLPADIIQKIEAIVITNDNRPNTEEAWGIASRLVDENETVVITTEIQEAWSVAYSLIEMGDKFSAARAFKEKYESIVAKNRANRMAVNWIAALGFNVELRDQAIRQAVKNNLISVSYAKKVLPNFKAIEGRYEEIKNHATVLLEDKRAVIAKSERLDDIKNAAIAHKQRIDALNAAILATEKRVDGTKCKRDSLAIFEEAERLDVFTSQFDKNKWCKIAASGESMRDLQIIILEFKQHQKALKNG